MADDDRRSYGLPSQPDLQKPVFLASAGDEMEAGVIRSLLESCGIPSRSRNVGIGAYMGVVLGTNRFGIEIDVAESDLEMAKKLLAAHPLSDEAAAHMIEDGDASPADVAPDESSGFADDVDELDPDGVEPVDESSVYEDADGAPTGEKGATNFWWILLLLLVGIPLLVAVLIRVFF